ncbi:MAG: hypothetical protein WCT23_07200 [Candidatus Neomarinimicrobiota bacterium]
MILAEKEENNKEYLTTFCLESIDKIKTRLSLSLFLFFIFILCLAPNAMALGNLQTKLLYRRTMVRL